MVNRSNVDGDAENEVVWETDATTSWKGVEVNEIVFG